MSTSLKESISVLEYICSIKDKKLRSQNLKYVSKDPRIYSALREIAHNAVRGNIKISKNLMKKLNNMRYKRVIYELSKKQKSRRKQRQLVEQSGGFLPYLIPAVVSIISALT
jgi:hypothetical protein